MLVLNLPAFENKKYTAYDRFHGNCTYGEIPTKKEPIRTFGFISRLPCHVIIKITVFRFLKTAGPRTLSYKLSLVKVFAFFFFSVEGRVSLTGSSQNLFNLSLLRDLLSSLLQVGQLYAHQGAVREALRHFVDGITLARQFSLSYR